MTGLRLALVGNGTNVSNIVLFLSKWGILYWNRVIISIFGSIFYRNNIISSWTADIKAEAMRKSKYLSQDCHDIYQLPAFYNINFFYHRMNVWSFVLYFLYVFFTIIIFFCTFLEFYLFFNFFGRVLITWLLHLVSEGGISRGGILDNKGAPRNLMKEGVSLKFISVLVSGTNMDL